MFIELTPFHLIVFAIGSGCLAILARNAHVWWLERQAKKESERDQRAVERVEARYYRQMADEAIQYIEEMYKEK